MLVKKINPLHNEHKKINSFIKGCFKGFGGSVRRFFHMVERNLIIKEVPGELATPLQK